MKEIEITPEMIEAGFNASYSIGVLPFAERTNARRQMVQDVFRAMLAASPKPKLRQFTWTHKRGLCFCWRETDTDFQFDWGFNGKREWERSGDYKSAEEFMAEHPDAVEIDYETETTQSAIETPCTQL